MWCVTIRTFAFELKLFKELPVMVQVSDGADGEFLNEDNSLYFVTGFSSDWLNSTSSLDMDLELKGGG